MPTESNPHIPAISVVIATLGRDTLEQAVNSALDQSTPPLEVIVVFDLDEPPKDFPTPERVRILHTGQTRSGVNVARMLGIAAAQGDAVALLDDDDYWYPEKLERQGVLMAELRAQGCRAVIGCGLDYLADEKIVYSGPTTYVRRGQRMPDYMFRRRQIRDGGVSMGPSSLLVDRELIQAVPFDPTIHLHEDWDWLLRAAEDPRFCFDQVHERLFAYRIAPQGTAISTSHRWAESVAWIDARCDLLTKREYGDLLLCVAVSLAVDSGDRRAATRLLLQGLRRGRPGWAALIIAIGTLALPRQGSRQLWPVLDRIRKAQSSISQRLRRTAS